MEDYLAYHNWSGSQLAWIKIAATCEGSARKTLERTSLV